MNTAGKVRLMCRHCHAAIVTRPRGLCWHCYYVPGLREQYVSGSKYARRGTPNFTGARPLPAEPTTANPGTPEKMQVLAERSARGEQLWHPDDA